ncbi:MAG: TRAP transporter substrate-binding protein [bacterium]|nr:TRAP transporter substrate-binding protein [bacterium]
MRKLNRLTGIAAASVAALALAACGGGGGNGGTTAPAGGGETTPAAGGETTPEAGGNEGGSSEGKDMRLALNQTETHPSYVVLNQMGEDLSEATDGRWSVDVFPNSTLGDQGEYIQMVSSGVVDLAIVSAPQLENINGDFVIFSLPTVFTDIDAQMSVLTDMDIVGDIYSSLEESNSVTVLGPLTQGERNMYTKDRVETPADLAGMKIRVQESPVFLAMIEALGGSPTPMAYGEVYTGLQSGVIDGAENNMISYESQKHYEVAPYYALTRHLVGADFLIVNTDTLNSMSAEDRAAFDETWTTAWTEHTELWKTNTETAISEAEAGGATFTEVDAAAFQEALTPLLDEFLTTPEQQALLESIKVAQ